MAQGFNPRKLRNFVLIALVLFSPATPADALLDAARAHIDSGNPERAWQLLAPHNSERAGEVEFDYLLGIAALDSGRRTEAVFALERVLAVDPDHAQARAEIARAYFELNELRRAREQFDQVLEDDSVPDAARQRVSAFLSAIEEIESDKKTVWNAYASLSLGSDDNVNAGPSSSQVAVPAFGGAIVVLDDTALETESSYYLARARGNLQHALGEKTDLVAGLGVDSRLNSDSDAEDFDYSSLDANFGIRYKRSDISHFTVSLQLQDFRLDGDDYRDAAGLLGQWRYRVSSNREMSLYGKLTDIEFPDQSARDADRHIVGGGFSHFFPGKRNPLIYVGLYVGEEETKDSDFSHLGFEFLGLRLGTQAKLTDRSFIYASLNFENREYNDEDPFFLETRDDDFTSATLGLRYKWDKNWAFSPEVFWSDNSSNIDLNENDKTSFSITARYDF